MSEAKRYDERFTVWSSLHGNHFTGIVSAHLLNPGTGRTFCGKQRGRMTTRYTRFYPDRDCKRCLQAVIALDKRAALSKAPAGKREAEMTEAQRKRIILDYAVMYTSLRRIAAYQTPEWQRILAVEQARLAELRRGMKEGSE